MSHKLPVIPNIDHLRKQAKDNLRLCRAGDVNAINQAKLLLPEYRNSVAEEIGNSIRLCDMLTLTARGYGFEAWQEICDHVTTRHDATAAMSAAMADPRMEDPDFRCQLGVNKGLPPLGTSRSSTHGVLYTVVDYLPAISCESVARVMAGRAMAHIEDLLPVIEFPEISPRLKEFLLETDCATTKQMIFFDTMPPMHPATAAPGLNQVCWTGDPTVLFFHFDAADVHETIIAHELGHIWGGSCGRVRRPPPNAIGLQISSRMSKFSNIQSFVMDLRVNDLLHSRGFDVSIISDHQAETVRNLAANCARGERPRYRRLLGSVVAAIAGALLEMDRFPTTCGIELRNCFEVIRISMPDVFEAAVGFVASVKCHGYANSAAERRVVDECVLLSFAVTGDSIDIDNDLVEVPHAGYEYDKHPKFLPYLPLEVKLDVLRHASRHGITGRAEYDVTMLTTGRVEVKITDPRGEMATPVTISYQHPRQPRAEEMCCAPVSYEKNPFRNTPSILVNVPSQLAPIGLPGRGPFSGFDTDPMCSDLRCHPGSSPATHPASKPAAAFETPNTPAEFKWQRSYMAGFGLWISRVGFERQVEGEHPYGYCLNNPVTNIDPTGEVPCSPQTCCCNLIRATLDVKPDPVDDIVRWGDYVTPVVKYSLVPGSGKMCNIKWEEKTRYSYYPGVPTNKWFDVCKVPGLRCPNDEAPWSFPQTCPLGPTTWDQFTDSPSADKVAENDGSNWMLCIRITLTSGCGGSPIVRYFKQQIRVSKSGKLLKKVPPGKSPALDRYCK